MISLLQHARLSTQILLLVAAAPIVFAVFGLVWVRSAVEVAMQGQPTHQIDSVTTAVGVGIAGAMVLGFIASMGASIVLTRSIRSVLREVRSSTATIATGDFSHRAKVDRPDELGALSHGINVMAERLENLELARRRMLASVSHELRTPLTVIKGFAWTLARHENDQSRVAKFKTIDEEIDRLSQLIDDLLMTATIDAGGVVLRPERTNVGEFLQRVCDRMAVAARKDGVAVTCSPGQSRIWALVDQIRIGQVVDNLLANAIVHADAGSTVQVEVRRRSSREIRITVSNIGEPVRPEAAQQLFDPFVQGDRPTGRAGLGLAIAKQLVALHSGSIDVRCSGRDTTFVIDLPSQLADESSEKITAKTKRMVGYELEMGAT